MNNNKTETIAHDFFYVGGEYTGPPSKEVMSGQMYVEVLRPAKVTRRYPLVFVHGTAQTATNWLKTPDGRPGWARIFVELGYEVYLVDQPSRGRSAWHAQLDGELSIAPVALVERYFTATTQGEWPQAKKHKQWPGTGRKGDPVFDAFYAAHVPYVADSSKSQQLFQNAGAALLDKIGEAILITHSQSGPYGWLLADVRPSLVKAVVSIEPQGPPVVNMSMQQAQKGESQALDDTQRRRWGIADIELTYAPPLLADQQLAVVRSPATRADRLPGWMQQEPARQLINLQAIPFLIVTGEASFHALYDHATAAYLQQAGVPVTHWQLEEFGITGNGHMLMLERNCAEIAERLNLWIADI
ncbi:MAG: alpha/beta hydrolase [Pseudomonas sp.]|uniref:alpha/beta hydrolase n=1 Tax=Pseudomonas abieticivorans TaxID=2931382 RepID=UPI0020BF736D|nr:alpha/beta hydrolase [Pseudomonas sp. PIA16]MDE1164696.1 alpha/beta hydrolase [Pseudomonas sp.]